MSSGEKLFELLQSYLPTRRCVLLVGTGFSIGSKNYQKSELPNVAKLTEVLLSQTAIPLNEREDFTLNTAIEQYLAEGKNIADLSSLLFNNLHVDLVTDEQKIVANLPWHRIYLCILQTAV